MARARWEDYDDRVRTLLVHGKGGHERLLPVPDEVAEALAAVRVAATGPVVRSAAGEAVSPDTIGTRATALMYRAGVKHGPHDGVSLHALRHTAASDVLDRCGDVRVVQQMLGHAHLSTSATYLRRVDAGRLRGAMAGRHYT